VRSELVKKAETLWRCLSCNRLYHKIKQGATCPVCEAEQAAILIIEDNTHEEEHRNQE